MTTLEKIKSLTWFDTINKQKSILTEINAKVPAQPTEDGTFILKVIDGITQWVKEV